MICVVLRNLDSVFNDSLCVAFRCADSVVSQLVLQRFQQIVELLQDFRDRVRSDWSCQLDSVCGFILEQPLILHDQQGMLGVNCSSKVSQENKLTITCLLSLPGTTGP